MHIKEEADVPQDEGMDSIKDLLYQRLSSTSDNTKHPVPPSCHFFSNCGFNKCPECVVVKILSH